MNLDWNLLLRKDGKCGSKVIEPAAVQQQTEKKFKKPKKPKKPKHQPPPQSEPVEPAPRPKTPPPAPQKSKHQEIEPNSPAPSPKTPPQAPIPIPAPTPARAPAMATHKVCGHEYCQISSTSLCCNCGDSRKKTRLYEKLRFYCNYFT